MGEYLEATYAELPYQPAYVDLFTRYFGALAALPGSILIHCSAGKDRTGILAALTLNLLGVHRDDIMHDYLLTNDISSIAERLPRLKERLAAQHEFEPDDTALATLLRVEPAYLSRMYRAIAKRSVSVDQYLETVLAVPPALRALIRANLVT
jgi:protein tyrosine/serine phosphatase